MFNPIGIASAQQYREQKSQTMNAANPFQIPSCFQVDQERRRRERFKNTSIAVMASFALLMVALLVEGFVSEQAKTADALTNVSSVQANPIATAPAPRPSSVPHPLLQRNPAPALRPAPSASKENVTAPASHFMAVYVVKAGDTLTRIARRHGTTVKAIEVANGLESDRIIAGEKLKMPDA